MKEEELRQAIIERMKKEIAVDLAKLERDGVISKIGDGPWYRVPNFKALPRDCGLLADGIATDSKGGKIRIPKNAQQRAAKLLKQLIREK
ncbi:MAG TPA: hypothetical protein VMX38_06815 [Verrucomicrobiae bacterium]|nr:hypothetical protein [Verrucomicrobiae bacterium]